MIEVKTKGRPSGEDLVSSISGKPAMLCKSPGSFRGPRYSRDHLADDKISIQWVLLSCSHGKTKHIFIGKQNANTESVTVDIYP